jgi:hypothetical protein
MSIVDINKASKSDLLILNGIGNVLAKSIIKGRPFLCRNQLLEVPGISERLLLSLERQGLKIGEIPSDKTQVKSRLYKYSAWAPRPVKRLIKGERPVLIVYEPNSGIYAGFDVKDKRMPLNSLYTTDKSAVLNIEFNEPRFKMKTGGGSLEMDSTGLLIHKKSRKKKIKWDEESKIVNELTQLAFKDEIFRTIGVNLGRGLRKAASSTRELYSVNPDPSTGEIPGTIPIDTPTGDTQSDLIAQKKVPYCSGKNSGFQFGGSIIANQLSLGVPIIECTEEVIKRNVRVRLKPTRGCFSRAREKYENCIDECNKGPHYPGHCPACRARCEGYFLADKSFCLGERIVWGITEISETVEHCVTKSGYVATEEGAQEGDIIIFESEGGTGDLIDSTTCGYGYSQAALLCGDQMVHMVGDGMVTSSIDHYGDRKSAAVRLGLSDEQIKALCSCMQNVRATQPELNYDAIETVTFLTVDDPGRDILTMFIMSCLDSIGFDRKALGLGGFVSPNDLARQLGAPSASNL